MGTLNKPNDNTGKASTLASAGHVALKVLKGALWVLRRLADTLSIAMLCAMVVLIMAQICGRYIFNYSIAWSEEAAIFAQVWLVMVGAGIAMRNRNHVAVDVLVKFFPVWLQRIAKAASFLLGVWLLGVVIMGSFSLIAIGQIVKSTALQIPLAIPYAALPIGMSYFLLEFAIATVPEIRNPATRAPATMGEA